MLSTYLLLHAYWNHIGKTCEFFYMPQRNVVLWQAMNLKYAQNLFVENTHNYMHILVNIYTLEMHTNANIGVVRKFWCPKLRCQGVNKQVFGCRVRCFRQEDIPKCMA